MPDIPERFWRLNPDHRDKLTFAVNEAIKRRAGIEARFAPCFSPGSPNAATAQMTEHFQSRAEADSWLKNNPAVNCGTPEFLQDRDWITADTQVKALTKALSVEWGKDSKTLEPPPTRFETPFGIITGGLELSPEAQEAIVEAAKKEGM